MSQPRRSCSPFPHHLRSSASFSMASCTVAFTPVPGIRRHAARQRCSSLNSRSPEISLRSSGSIFQNRLAGPSRGRRASRPPRQDPFPQQCRRHGRNQRFADDEACSLGSISSSASAATSSSSVSNTASRSSGANSSMMSAMSAGCTASPGARGKF